MKKTVIFRSSSIAKGAASISLAARRQPRDGRNQRRKLARAIPRQDRQRDRNDLAKRCRPDPHRPAIRSSRTVCTAAWVPIVPPKVVDFGDSIDRTRQLVGRLHQRHLKPTQCPTIRAISRKIDTTVRTTPTSHPTVAGLPIVFREGLCSLSSTKPGSLRKPLQDRCV